MNRLYDLQKFCRAESGWLIDTAEALVRLESPTTDKAAVDRCGAELARRIDAIGGRVTRMAQRERGDHLLARFTSGGEASGRQILLLGHFDTVWSIGDIERMPLARADGRLSGPGVFDMKAGIALAMVAARALIEFEPAAARRLAMLWTTDEEVGSATSRALIEEEARKSAAVLVLEPSLPGGAVKTSRKGCGQYDVVVRGVPAHAGIEPGRGASAIHELAHQICELSALANADRGLSVNVGLITGGTRPNVVAEEARAVVDVRAASRVDMEALDEAVRRQTSRDPRTRLEISGGFDRPPLERTAGVVRLYEMARTVAAELGSQLAEGGTGGGSDGNFTAALGVPTLDGLGAIGDGAHARHEYVETSSLADRAALVAGLISRIE